MCQLRMEIVYLKLIRPCRLVKKQQQFHFIMSEIVSRKLMMIGDRGVGKTSLLEVFDGGVFVEKRYRPSVLTARVPRIKHPTLEGVEVGLQL